MQQDPENSNPSTTKTWLDGLQQESWQLELLISGFSIFLLLGVKGALWEMEYDLVLLKQSSERFFILDALYYGGRIAYAAVTLCLIVHVILRGLWIAAIGLRSVSGDIDYDHFRYQPFFMKRLRKGMGSFDGYIERLEKYCSLLFSFAFLTFFCFFGLVIYIILSNTLSEGLSYLLTGEGFTPGNIVYGIISLTIFILGIVYAIDFVTFGYLKRWKWWGKIYYYFYILMGWVTLARFYRPLYYNLIDNSFGRKFARALPLTIVLLIAVASLRYSGKTYIPGYLQGGTTWISSGVYEDNMTDITRMAWGISIPSRYVPTNYVDLFVPYIPINDDEILRMIDPDITPGRSRGAYLEGGFNLGSRNLPDADNEVMLAAFRAKYKLYVNDSLASVAPRFYYHKNRQQHGILYPIPVHDLPDGEHRLRLDRRKHRTDSILYSKGTSFYFYK